MSPKRLDKTSGILLRAPACSSIIHAYNMCPPSTDLFALLLSTVIDIQSVSHYNNYTLYIIIGRAGASPPSRATGAKFLYIYVTCDGPDTIISILP